MQKGRAPAAARKRAVHTKTLKIISRENRKKMSRKTKKGAGSRGRDEGLHAFAVGKVALNNIFMGRMAFGEHHGEAIR
jgi:hypothetical protein